MKRLPRRLGILLLLSALISCRSPATRIDRQAQDFGLRKSVIRGPEFDHVVYERRGSGDGRSLHVYLEGDGSPWIDEARVASDPTPRRAYALELMALDPGASVYIGRPCYHGQTGTKPCEPRIWTHDRYSERVVDSLASAIRAITVESDQEGLVLIGYSGGGVLAMLLAERLETTRFVVTVAANLDIDAWTDLHQYSTLADSLNPATRPPLPSTIRQLHLAGGKDQRVPANMIEAVADLQPNSEFLLYPDFDHTCCWPGVWPQILERIAPTSD